MIRTADRNKKTNKGSFQRQKKKTRKKKKRRRFSEGRALQFVSRDQPNTRHEKAKSRYLRKHRSLLYFPLYKLNKTKKLRK